MEATGLSNARDEERSQSPATQRPKWRLKTSLCLLTQQTNMAKPIPLEFPARDPRTELQARLQNAPLEHAQALLAAYEVLQGLHDRGVFEPIRGTLGSSDKVIEILVEASK